MISSSKISKLEVAKLCLITRVDVPFHFMDVAEERNPTKLIVKLLTHWNQPAYERTWSYARCWKTKTGNS